MPVKMFQVNTDELRRLAKLYRRMPRQFQQASARMLSSFAFGTRTESLSIINRRMIVRNKRFVTGSIRVDKARGNQPLGKQVSRVGSIERRRFSGWREQELGEQTSRSRIADLFARGGDSGKQVKPSLRMKSGNQFMSPNDFPGRSAEHRVVVMLQILARRRHRKPFIIRGHPRFKRGLYQYKGRRLNRVQTFEPRNPQPRRVRWLSGGSKQYFQNTSIRDLWTENLRRTLKRKR